VKAFAIAADVLREASSRRWLLALGVAVTIALILIAFSLRLDVVDGALAATRLFGSDLHLNIRAAEVAMRAVFSAAAYVIYYGGLPFGILICADFAPRLLAPGRVEHLLALPIRRWELLAGTLLGVLTLSTGAALYGAGGLAIILGIKTGVWTLGPLLAAVLAGVSFSAVYAAMLTTAVFVRSAALSDFVGFLLFGFGVMASYRDQIVRFFRPGLTTSLVRGGLSIMPPIAALGDAAARIAGSAEVQLPRLMALIAGVLVFGAAVFAVGALRFDRKDY
jgi:Cu-processing system permease protein